MCDEYGEVCRAQKMFKNGLNMGLLQQTWVKKTDNKLVALW